MKFPQKLLSQAFLVASTMIIQFFLPRHHTRLRFMEARIRILKSRLGDKRIITTAEEQQNLNAFLWLDDLGGETRLLDSRPRGHLPEEWLG